MSKHRKSLVRAAKRDIVTQPRYGTPEYWTAERRLWLEAYVRAKAADIDVKVRNHQYSDGFRAAARLLAGVTL